jgi:hypothetical protein
MVLDVNSEIAPRDVKGDRSKSVLFDACRLALFVWLISHQPTVLFSQNKPATSNQPAVLFSHNKSAPAISHQPNEQAVVATGAAAAQAVVHHPRGAGGDGLLRGEQVPEQLPRQAAERQR